MTLGRYNGSRGKSPYPNAVFANQRFWVFNDREREKEKDKDRSAA